MLVITCTVHNQTEVTTTFQISAVCVTARGSKVQAERALILCGKARQCTARTATHERQAGRCCKERELQTDAKQHSTAQHSTAQHSRARHSTHLCPLAHHGVTLALHLIGASVQQDWVLPDQLRTFLGLRVAEVKRSKVERSAVQ
jgi:hypothetical protein